VRLVDRIAYINHDIDDAIRAGVLAERDLPQDDIAILGRSGSERIDLLVHDLVEHSEVAGDIVQGEEVGAAMARLRDFMFERVYLGEAVRSEHVRVTRVIRALFDHFLDNPQLVETESDDDLPTRVTDYLAGMTDRFCIRVFEAIALPRHE
jgi:dGTPase